MNALLGTKVRQTQMFTEDGRRMPVTEIVAGPNWIVAVGDKRIQLGFGSLTHLTKAETGHIKKAGLTEKLRFLRSFAVTEVAETEVAGAKLGVADVFAVGDAVRVTGTSKGKGFAGVVKRHGFKGGPRSHGQSDRERAPGSIGATTTPGRVYRGKRMAGRMGTDKVTVIGLTVVAVNPEANTLLVKGVVPGGKNGLVVIQKEAARIVSKRVANGV